VCSAPIAAPADLGSELARVRRRSGPD